MTFIIKSGEIPNRMKVPYVKQGDPSGLSILLLHGFTDSWHSFERVLPYLPPGDVPGQVVHILGYEGIYFLIVGKIFIPFAI